MNMFSVSRGFLGLLPHFFSSTLPLAPSIPSDSWELFFVNQLLIVGAVGDRGKRVV